LLLLLLSGCNSASGHSDDPLERGKLDPYLAVAIARLHSGDAPPPASTDLPPPPDMLAPPALAPPAPQPDLAPPAPQPDLAPPALQPDLAPPATQPDLAPAPPSHKRCGWIGGGDTVGENAFVQNAAQYDTIHPKWWALADDGFSVRVAGNPDLASVVSAARANRVRIMPLVDGESGDLIRSMMNDATRRANHVANLVKLAVDHGYDGLDIDYEHLWTAADRPGFVAFMTQLSAAMHAAGKELSMAVGAIPVDHGDNGYPYETLVSLVDTMHVMTYDFHYISNSHLGPIAPLGWVDAVFARAQATGHPEKFMVGLANYAIGNGWWTSTRDALSRCGSGYATTTTHMLTCPFGTWNAGRSPHCTTASGDLWFEDVASMEEKVQTAKKRGARGVTYWTVGDESRDISTWFVATSRDVIKFASMDADEMNPHGFNAAALLVSAGKGELDMIRRAIEIGIDVDIQDKRGWSALMVAAQMKQPLAAQLLIELGADVNLATERGQTALMTALGSGDDVTARLLLEKGADLSAQRVDGFTCLMAAAQGGNLEIATRLLDGGEPADGRDGSGGSALSYAAEKGHEAMVKLLLGRGADRNQRDNERKSPADWARQNGHTALADLLSV
jgi:hypothetical protein